MRLYRKVINIAAPWTTRWLEVQDENSGITLQSTHYHIHSSVCEDSNNHGSCSFTEKNLCVSGSCTVQTHVFKGQLYYNLLRNLEIGMSFYIMYILNTYTYRNSQVIFSM